MKCSEIMAKLEELSPLSFAESWIMWGFLSEAGNGKWNP